MSTFLILICNEEQYTYVDSGKETLLSGQTWAFSGANNEVICGTVVEPSNLGIPNFSAMTQYSGCGECLENTVPTFSANTEDNLCVDCNGTTVIYNQEHPVWTNQYGQTVTQLNAVELGGRNGFYA